MPTTTIDNLPRTSTIAPFGELDTAYYAQTFVAAGERMQSLDFEIDNTSGGPTKYNLLITTVLANGGNRQPDLVLKEIVGLEVPDDGGGFERVHVNLGGLELNEGQTYAFVLDSFVARDGENDLAQMGTRDGYGDGLFFYYNVGAGGGERGDHFNADWTENGTRDLAFEAVFSDLGAVIEGTKKDDKINANKSPKGEPLATNDDDIIDGKKGNDKIKGEDGFDIIKGGKGKDKLKGGDDGDILNGQKGRDKLYGQDGEDCFLFDFKITKKSAKKHFDKIYNYEEKDTIYLSEKHFDIPLGQVQDADPYLVYKNDKLFYEGYKIVKFKGSTPDSLEDIDFVVVA